MPKASGGDQKVTMVIMPALQVTMNGIATPSNTPMMPPAPESRTVSTRNCSTMSALVVMR